MPNHRVSPGSLSVTDLLDVAEIQCASSHRADSFTTGRFRAVAGIAVAAGALLTAGAHLTPAVANAAPVTPADEEPADVAETTPAPVQVTPPATIATPFGLVGLAPEIAAPLAQAEQFIRDIQQQVVDAQQQAVVDTQQQVTDVQEQVVQVQQQVIASLPITPSIPLAPAPAPAPPLTISPTVLPVVGGQISSGFGNRWGEFHYGVDIADPIGTPIRSVMSGTVLEAGPASGFGQWVRVRQDDGTIAVYGHVNDMYVQAGQHVNVGDIIASVGNRGQSTGPHLHLEIWDTDGTKIDPVAWLAGKGILMQQHWGAD